MNRHSRNLPLLHYGAIALTLIIVAGVDQATPLGLAVWIFYVVPVALTLFVNAPLAPIVTAAAASALIGAGYFMSPGKALLLHDVAQINRVMGGLTLWLLAGVASLYIRSRLNVQRMAWLQHGQMEVNMQLRGEQTPESIGNSILGALVPYIGASVGVLYTREDDALERLATWALPDDGSAPRRIRRSEGLAGQVLVEARALRLRHAPASYLKVASALGSAQVAQIVAAPLLADGEVVGVIELGFLGEGGRVDDANELLERAAESMGMAVRSARYRLRLIELLGQTQQQSEELQVQQEELRVSNEELEERGRALMESQGRLENQQAELEQTNVQLEEHTQHLERQKTELQRTQQVLADNALALERASQYKSEFLANMSHELRTPLNSSLILAKLLQDNKSGNLSDEEVRYAATIHSSNIDLLSLINDILDLSKVEAGQMDVQFARASVDALLQSLSASFAPVAASKHVALVLERAPDVPPELVTDSQRLQQVLRNLVANAFKFTERGEVAVEVHRAGEEAVRFDVRDTGIGIAPEKQELIFQAFQQADGTTSRRYGGSGLGLSISREFTRLLGGAVSVRSEVGQGSVFSVTLPLNLREGTVQAERDSAEPLAARARTAAGAAPGLAPSAAPDAPPMGWRAVSPTANTPAGAHAGGGFGTPGLPGAPLAPGAPTSAASPAIAPIADDRDARRHGERVILAIEDDRDFAQILYDLAHELDFDCVHATSAAEGVALARDLRPSGILLDVGLPDQSGLTVLERLKHDPLTRHIPIHMVSATDHAAVALHLGAIGYTRKPGARDALADAIRTLEARSEQGVRRVLVVEDDPALRHSIHVLLRSEMVEIVETGTIAGALEEIERRCFDCIVMDLALPDGSGYDLLEQASRRAEHGLPPVIVYTGRSLSQDEEQRLRRYSRSIIIKGAKSPERLLDEVTLFLHSVESTLPPEQQRMLRAARQRDDVFEQRTIMLAEDDVRNIFALSHVLEPLGATLEIARNGREALEALARRTDIDLVLMDVMMPEMDGLTAIREIRRQPEHARLPIIALTAKAMASDRQRCLDAGADDYISKPIDVNKLIALCRVWLGQP